MEHESDARCTLASGSLLVTLGLFRLADAGARRSVRTMLSGRRGHHCVESCQFLEGCPCGAEDWAAVALLDLAAIPGRCVAHREHRPGAAWDCRQLHGIVESHMQRERSAGLM